MIGKKVEMSRLATSSASILYDTHSTSSSFTVGGYILCLEQLQLKRTVVV